NRSPRYNWRLIGSLMSKSLEPSLSTRPSEVRSRDSDNRSQRARNVVDRRSRLPDLRRPGRKRRLQGFSHQRPAQPPVIHGRTIPDVVAFVAPPPCPPQDGLAAARLWGWWASCPPI